jgi:hypothetical protein
MSICTTALKVARREKMRRAAEQSVDKQSLLAALRHIKACPSCTIEYTYLIQRLDISEKRWEMLLPFLSKAIGMPPNTIFRETPVGQLRVASIMITLLGMTKRKPACMFYVDRMTVGKLLERLGLGVD